ncbi:MAG: hypothetical protein NTZ63_06945 [Candidatus Omnitrophica bacterium]|nr:hypothetical protein [Candidatus Omnitrophota bacterium]
MKIYTNNKGQAAAELAILGVLLLVTFSYVMNYGQSLGKTQQVKMETFRRALQKAYTENGSVSYTLRRNTNQASVNTSFFQGSSSAAEGSASVTWAKGQRGEQGDTTHGSNAYWQINKQAPIKLPYGQKYVYGPTGAESDEEMNIPVQVYKVHETRTSKYNLNTTKKESNAGIAYDKNASVIDTSVGTLHLRFDTTVDKHPGDDNTPTPQYDLKGTRGYSDTTNYDYNKIWSVNHGS